MVCDTIFALPMETAILFILAQMTSLYKGGQGNPGAPPMWVAITIILVRILAMYAPGCVIISSLSLITLSFSAIMYVDDTDLFVVGKTPKESITSIVDRSKDLVDIWCRSIWATGGLLIPDKCYWYLIGFKWTGSKWEYVRKTDIESTISIDDQFGNPQEV